MQIGAKVSSLCQRLIWWEPVWALAVALAVMLPLRLLPEELRASAPTWRIYALALLIVGWPLRFLAYGRVLNRTPMDIPLILMFAWLPVNYWASVDKSLSWEVLRYLISGGAVYFALTNWPPAEQHPELIAGLILTIGIGLIVATPLMGQLDRSKIFQVETLAPVLRQLADIIPGEGNNNRMAGALALEIPLFTALSLRWDWSRRRWLALACTLLTLGGAVCWY